MSLTKAASKAQAAPGVAAMGTGVGVESTVICCATIPIHTSGLLCAPVESMAVRVNVYVPACEGVYTTCVDSVGDGGSAGRVMSCDPTRASTFVRLLDDAAATLSTIGSPTAYRVASGGEMTVMAGRDAGAAACPHDASARAQAHTKVKIFRLTSAIIGAAKMSCVFEEIRNKKHEQDLRKWIYI